MVITVPVQNMLQAGTKPYPEIVHLICYFCTVLKIEIIAGLPKNITPAVKCLFFGLFLLLAFSFTNKKHPYYVSVVDIKYDVKQKAVQISARLFTNDLEDALRKTNKKTIDLLNPKIRSEVDSALFHYIKERFQISLNSKVQSLTYIGYEKEEESIWAYLEIKKTAVPKKININTRLLYDFLPQQINIIHTEINGIKKSSKVTNPDSKIEFSF